MKKLKYNKNFKPCEASEGEEIFPNGIFEFNISKLLQHIKENPEEFTPQKVLVKEYYSDFSNDFEETSLINLCNDPIIIAEISPGQYNVIDGNHRMYKAYKAKQEKIEAYIIKPETHTKFLTTQKAYNAYIDYWNEKIDFNNEFI